MSRFSGTQTFSTLERMQCTSHPLKLRFQNYYDIYMQVLQIFSSVFFSYLSLYILRLLISPVFQH